MKKAYIDLLDFDVQRGSLRTAVERVIANTNNQYSPLVFLVRPSHTSEIEGMLVERSDASVVSANNAAEVLTLIQAGRKRAAGFVPNDSTEFVFTFNPEVRNTVMGWKTQGWNVFTRRGSDLVAYNASVPSSSAPDLPAARSRNRKYEVAKQKAKKLQVYAEWRARRPIYDAMRAIIDAREDLVLAELKRAVARDAREAAFKAGFDLQPNHFFAANASVFRVALEVGVFRTDGGRAIGNQDVQFSVRVTGLDTDFRDRCDLCILECVINELGDVTDDHCLSLAHLMYGEGVSEADGGASLDVLDEKFSTLMKAFGNRLERTQFGFYRIASVGSEKVQSIAAAS
jgi:hypothetical protein